MRRSLLPLCAFAAASFSGGLTKFSAGAPAQASAVNDNFAYLDTAKASKATVDLLTSAVNAKAEKSALDGKADNARVDSLKTSLAAKADQAALKALTAASIGAVPVDAKGNATIAGSLTLAGNLSAKSVVADSVMIAGIRSISPNYHREVVFGSYDSYASSPNTNGLYVPTLINSAIRLVKDEASTTPFLSRNRSDGTWTKDLISVATDGTSGDKLILGSDVSVTGGLTSNSLAAQSITSANTTTSGVYAATRGASDVAWAGSYFRVVDASDDTKITKGWMIQLGASNTLDFWNYESESPTKRIWFNSQGSFLGSVSQDIGASNNWWRIGYFNDLRIQNNQVMYSGMSAAVEFKGNVAVAGSLKTAPGSVKSSDVADYVFEPSYKLPSLSEVEAFAKEHKHLPEVPSAKEIERGGLDLAQMNLVLLKKVEELTLHAIDQQKAIEEQRQEIAQVKAELKAIQRN